MKIVKTEIYKLTIQMEPFVIATEVCTSTQNIFIRIHTDSGIVGMGECSAFPMLVGETQNTCFEIAKDFASLTKDKDPLNIDERLDDLDRYIAFNSTIKSAWDMALFDIGSKAKNIPLFQFLGGAVKDIHTDLTIGIDQPEKMAKKAKEFIQNGVKILKVKLGKSKEEDIERIRLIRESIGNDIPIRIDANQGWNYITAIEVLNALGNYHIQFCEQPLHHHYDHLLPELRKNVPIKIMADESVFDHYDAIRLIESDSIDYINIKLAKSGGIREALKIADESQKRGIPCMLGGMTESRLGLTAKVHLALSHNNIQFYDLDTCLLGQLEDPVIGGATYDQYHLLLPDGAGLNADISQDFLNQCEKIII
ncbi:MAG: mandelate racemase/muconate lactonizing enzyme family protein [Chitinophagaceae bacterium]